MSLFTLALLFCANPTTLHLQQVESLHTFLTHEFSKLDLDSMGEMDRDYFKEAIFPFLENPRPTLTSKILRKGVFTVMHSTGCTQELLDVTEPIANFYIAQPTLSNKERSNWRITLHNLKEMIHPSEI